MIDFIQDDHKLREGRKNVPEEYPFFANIITPSNMDNNNISNPIENTINNETIQSNTPQDINTDDDGHERLQDALPNIQSVTTDKVPCPIIDTDDIQPIEQMIGRQIVRQKRKRRFKKVSVNEYSPAGLFKRHIKSNSIDVRTFSQLMAKVQTSLNSLKTITNSR